MTKCPLFLWLKNCFWAPMLCWLPWRASCHTCLGSTKAFMLVADANTERQYDNWSHASPHLPKVHGTWLPYHATTSKGECLVHEKDRQTRTWLREKKTEPLHCVMLPNSFKLCLASMNFTHPSLKKKRFSQRGIQHPNSFLHKMHLILERNKVPINLETNSFTKSGRGKTRPGFVCW